MDAKLVQLQSIGQKDKAQGYSSLIAEALAQQDLTAVARDVHTVLETALTEEHVGSVAKRQVLGELVTSLGNGAIKDSTCRRQVIEDALALAQNDPVSFEEQVCALCAYAYTHMLIVQ